VKKLFFSIFPFLFSLGLADAHAQSYPDRPIRFLVGFVAGGAVDLTARTLAQKMTERWGQQVIVDNRTGAGGVIVMQIAAKAPRDGYTIMMGSSTQFSIGPAMQAGPSSYEPLASFTPISQVVVSPIVLTVHPSVPARSVQELIQYGKTRSGQISFASPGAGTGSHIAGILLGRTAGFDIVHVPYKGGGDAIVAVVGGHLPLSLGAISTALPHIKGGRLRALGVTEARRLSIAPEVPTIAESGLPGFEVSQWYGVFAPAGIPAAITKKIGSELAAIVALPEAKDRLSSQGLEVVYSAPDVFGAYVKAERAKWSKLLKELGIQEKSLQ
jgi:tripartite-type tricarboxylate transporter receptor subunit TctC